MRPPGLRFDIRLALCAAPFVACACSGAPASVSVSPDGAAPVDDASSLPGEDGGAAPGAPDTAVSASLPTPSMLPAAPDDCPTLAEGEVMFGDSKVRVWVGDDGMSRLGPLVLYWHGTCSAPVEALAGIGLSGIARIKEQGGMLAAVASPYRSPNDFCSGAGLPATPACPGTALGNGVWCREDFELADRIVACALQQVGIDPRRIHSAGMSAGGVMSLEYADGRSGYLASVVSYSGGLLPAFLSGVQPQDPSNKFPAMIVHGGTTDVVGAADFEELAAQAQSTLGARGQFSFVCNHGTGHTIPAGIGDSAVRFFEDHPYGAAPEPYAAGLPASFPSYCVLP